MRAPMPFGEGFAATPAETAMRAHYAAHGGDVPMAPLELEPPPAAADESSAGHANAAVNVSSPPPAPRSSIKSVRVSVTDAAAPKSATKRTSLVDGAALRSLTVPALKKLCEEYDVSDVGKKEDLVKRLTDKGAKPPAGAGGAPTRSTPRRAKSDPNVDSQENAEMAAGGKKPALEKQPSAPAHLQGKGGAGLAKGGVRRSATAA